MYSNIMMPLFFQPNEERNGSSNKHESVEDDFTEDGNRCPRKSARN